MACERTGFDKIEKTFAEGRNRSNIVGDCASPSPTRKKDSSLYFSGGCLLIYPLAFSPYVFVIPTTKKKWLNRGESFKCNPGHVKYSRFLRCSIACTISC